jgi:UDP-sugar transporter A1/2/3
MSDNNKSIFSCMNSIRMVVLVVLCLQNSLFTVIRRYSLGTRQEKYSKYEVLLVSEIIKMIFSAYMILKSEDAMTTGKHRTMQQRLGYLISTSQKMIGLALIYGAMNTLSLISLKNIGAGMFTIFAQCKILTTAACSSIILHRQYSWTQWRALIALSLGVLLFSQPIWDKNDTTTELDPDANVLLGTAAVLIEVTLSGFSSIYFEKVIKTDPLQLSIWERNFQLAFGSVPVYLAFMAFTTSPAEMGAGWTPLAWGVALLGAAGGLLVALSIKYGDSILKTLATTGAIILSSVLDHVWLGGPLTPAMMIAAGQVVISICNYTFDTTPAVSPPVVSKSENGTSQSSEDDEEMALINEKK